jgi:hypothetical protein
MHHQHQEVLDPAVWGTLPDKTVAYGFCTLALLDINRLKSLSKGWRQTATGLEFRQARIDGGSFATRLYDMQTNSWHSFVMHIFLGIHFEMMFASNGGLKCSVSTSNNKSPKPEDDQLLMVCNPFDKRLEVTSTTSSHDKPP